MSILMDVTQDLEQIALQVKDLKAVRDLLELTGKSMLDLFEKINGESDIRLVHHNVVPVLYTPTIVLRGDEYAGIMDVSEYREKGFEQRTRGLGFQFRGVIDGEFVKAGCNVFYFPAGFKEGKNLINLIFLDQEALKDYFALFLLGTERNEKLYPGEQALFYDKPVGFRITEGVANRVDPHTLKPID